MRSSFCRLALVLLAALGAAAFRTAPAQAQGVQAVAVVDLNMRQGPGTRYRPVLTIPRGARMPVLRCTSAYEWCEVGYAGRAGWVAARYLRDTRPRYDDRPLSDIGALLGLVLQELAEQNRRPDRDDSYDDYRPGRYPGAGEACFYEHADYRGRSFCASVGDRDRRLGSFWNDRISSIRVGRRASVQVCEHQNFGGWCRTLRDDVALLRGAANDAISSYEVRRAGYDWDDGYGGGARRRACFFEHAYFRGDRICFNAGEGTALLPPEWNDRISSIRLEGGARTRVCQHQNFGGWCEMVRGDAARFSPQHNDEISSIQVF